MKGTTRLKQLFPKLSTVIHDADGDWVKLIDHYTDYFFLSVSAQDSSSGCVNLALQLAVSKRCGGPETILRTLTHPPASASGDALPWTAEKSGDVKKLTAKASVEVACQVVSRLKRLADALDDNPMLATDSDAICTILSQKITLKPTIAHDDHDPDDPVNEGDGASIFETIGGPRTDEKSSPVANKPIHVQLDYGTEGPLVTLLFPDQVPQNTRRELARDWCDFLDLRYEIFAEPNFRALKFRKDAVSIVCPWDRNQQLEEAKTTGTLSALEKLLERHVGLLRQLSLHTSDDVRSTFHIENAPRTTPKTFSRSAKPTQNPPPASAISERVFGFKTPTATAGDGSLFDLVLTDPGTSEFRTGKVLAIILSISYPEALDVISQAPCTIVWSVGRPRALELKSVIEQTGAKTKVVASH